MEVSAEQLITDKCAEAASDALLATMRTGSGFRDSLKLSVTDMGLRWPDISIRVKAHMLTRPLSEESETASVRVPVTWWQHFKRDVLPWRLRRRWPVKTRELSEVVHYKVFAAYPQASVAMPASVVYCRTSETTSPIKLVREKVGVEGRINMEIAEVMEMGIDETPLAEFAGGLALDLQEYALTTPKSEESATVWFNVPATWWQQFKQDVWPTWLLRLSPVRDRELSETVHFGMFAMAESMEAELALPGEYGPAVIRTRRIRGDGGDE